MSLERVTVAEQDLVNRIRARLLNGASPAGGNGGTAGVVWSDGDSELLLHVDTLSLRLTGGWLLVNLELETLETGRIVSRIPFFLGRADRAGGLQAATGQDPAANALLVERWQGALQTAIWDGVLDVLEGSLSLARQLHPTPAPTLIGYVGHEGVIQVTIGRG